MISFFGDYDTTETVVLAFNSFSSDDPSASVTLTDLANTDVYIYKDGSLTQRNSSAGVAVDVNVDGIAGNHWVTIDLSDNTDAGFYSNGSRYQARMEGVTIDGATINAWIGAWSVGCTLRPTNAGRKLDVTTTGAAGIDWANIENKTTANDLSQTDMQLCDTVTTNSDMVGTDNAALASVVGALADAAAAGEVTSADTLMKYIKQLINILIGTPGIGTFPAEAAPGNAVSLAEVIRAIHVDVTGLNGDAMRGTDSANTTVPDAAGTAPTAIENRQEMDSNSTELAKIGTIPALDGAGQTIGAAIAKLADDNGGANFDATNDSLERIANTAPLGTAMRGTDGSNTTVPDAAGTAPTAVEINGEVVDALTTDTYAEPGQEAPGATVSLSAKIGYLYKLARNKITNDGSTISVYNDAEAVVDQKSTVSEVAGTVTRGEFGTGP